MKLWNNIYVMKQPVLQTVKEPHISLVTKRTDQASCKRFRIWNLSVADFLPFAQNPFYVSW